ncbi:glycosyltransferase family protein [Desulfovibrio inopinatus]|uniref:glycosyltransferase family protein n=1 Tax=Desulfovibrio inopinatus TaxID=102109 RepID=UPI0003FF1749|nr:glycosyltransferase family protein [Desulfovibrio inopinatus]
MARILYGVHGTQHGHAIRALTIARHLGEHEILFVSSEEGAELLAREYRVETALNPGTRYKNYQIDTPATLKLAANVLRQRGREVHRLVKIAEAFKPDVCLSDYEYFVPLVSKKMGIPCLSVDHQHVISLCSHPVPPKLWIDYAGISTSIRFLFSHCDQYLAISFYRPPVKPGLPGRIAPPILRESVGKVEASQGDHILVYQSCSICDDLVPFLKRLQRPCLVYGYNRSGNDGNITFRPYSETQLLEDLASAAYVICGGGHSLISESLYYGKPILSLPVAGAFEQQLNAIYIEHLGYGMNRTMADLSPALIATFESKLDSYVESVASQTFCGNTEVFGTVEGFVRTGRMDIASSA